MAMEVAKAGHSKKLFIIMYLDIHIYIIRTVVLEFSNSKAFRDFFVTYAS